MDEYKNLRPYGWLPEQSKDLINWRQTLGEYNEHHERETSEQPLVIDWEILRKRVADQKTIRDNLRDNGFNFWPWNIAKHFKIDWLDFNQGNRGSCAGCATNNAVNSMLLTHLADGYKFAYRRFNPYYTWDLGKRDAGYGGEGATISSMLTCANVRGMFDVARVGEYSQTCSTGPDYSADIIKSALKYQIGACYLGGYSGADLARIVFDCVAAGYPVVMGTSAAVSDQTKMIGNIKTAINRGSWMHATARVAYRLEADGTEYIAHQGSWGAYWDRGPEQEPASIVWESFDTFTDQCSGRYVDAFAVTMVEGETLENPGESFAPIKITEQ